MKTTSIYEKIAQAWIDGKRHIWLEGGTAASKTYSVIQFLGLVTRHAKNSLLVSCVSESVPHLKRGIIRDFYNIEGDNFRDCQWNRTDSVYTYGKGVMEFFSADMPSKLRGGRRDILYLNEMNNLPYDAFRELDSRTRICTIGDWNPTSEFWFHQNGLANEEGACYIHATYKDALNVIPPEVVKNIEAMGARDPNWANVYLEGRLGKIEGLVYPHFEQEDRLPEGGNVFFGLDFGYSTDPTALVKCVIKGDELHRQELIYEKGLSNDQISHRFEELGLQKRHDLIIADSAEPKSIDEIYRYGWNIFGCSKGAGSVEFGHQKVRQYKLFWTKDSLNGIKEQRNFRFLPDKDGKLTDKTTHSFSHLMDAVRYGVMYISRSTIPDFSIQGVGKMRTNIGGR